MNDILTEDGLININPEGDLYYLNMRQRLDSVKHHPSGKDLFICPINLKDQIGNLLNGYHIPYECIKDTININPIEIKRQMDRYLEIDVFTEKPVGFITPFDNNALFKWSKQLFGDDEDPVYAAYLDHVDEITDAYYEQYYKLQNKKASAIKMQMP